MRSSPQSRGSTSGRTGLSAYRADRPAGGQSSAAHNEALFVATLVRHAVAASLSRKEQQRLLAYASRVARLGLGPKLIAAGCLYDRGAARSASDVLRLMAERAEQAGLVNVAESIFESLASLSGLGNEVIGRVMADRARNSLKRGFVDLSDSQYRALLGAARHYRSLEMEARASIGLAALAQVRGNFPEMRRRALKGVRIALKCRLYRLAAGGEAGLGAQAATAGKFSEAVEHFWNGYKLARGDQRLEPELLTNVAQAFQDSNRPREARIAASAVLKSSPVLRIALPALGVFALSSGVLGDRAAVEWSAKQAVKLARVRGYARAVAGTLFDCAAAYDSVGQWAQSGVLERRAQAIALRHGFNDLTFRKATVSEPTRPTTLAGRAMAAASEVAKLESEPLLADLELAPGVEA